ncbi:adenylosuccinate lyase [Maribacter algicola]|uniref:Adenylosuccinate lyase n=1 Tax=Meishania litoralis TaxID=3434685 RepID=A0ACC7LQG4_9FLAO
MKKTELYDSLNYVDHSREKRMQMAMLVLNDPQVIAPLLEIAFVDDDPISSRACWVMEFTAKENLSYLLPYLDDFTANLGKIQLDSSVRPIAKICEFLTKAYFSKKSSNVQIEMTEEHLERIATACFDWLIGDHKVAAKAYSMTSLLLLGRKFNWILPELKMVLEQNYAEGSAAYKARARMTLAKIK